MIPRRIAAGRWPFGIDLFCPDLLAFPAHPHGGFTSLLGSSFRSFKEISALRAFHKNCPSLSTEPHYRRLPPGVRGSATGTQDKSKWLVRVFRRPAQCEFLALSISHALSPVFPVPTQQSGCQDKHNAPSTDTLLAESFLTFGCGDDSEGGSITYHIENYAVLQNGYTLSGTITTDGMIGTLTDADITAWSFSVTGPTSYPIDVPQSPGATVVVVNLTATASAPHIGPSRPIGPTRGNSPLAHYPTSCRAPQLRPEQRGHPTRPPVPTISSIGTTTFGVPTWPLPGRILLDYCDRGYDPRTGHPHAGVGEHRLPRSGPDDKAIQTDAR